MATLFDFVKVKLPKKQPVCYECNETGHLAYNCKARKEQYKKLGLPLTKKLAPLKCYECKTTSNLITCCKHVICNNCDEKINHLGVCNLCSFEQTRLPIFRKIAP